jgi:hypothetical protein
MTEYTEEEHEAVRAAVEELFRETAGRFAHATVRTDLPGPGGHPSLIELACSVPGTARISALPGADQIDLYIGQGAWLEVTASRRHPEALLDRVAGVVERVVRGRFHERVGWRRLRYQAYR